MATAARNLQISTDSQAAQPEWVARPSPTFNQQAAQSPTADPFPSESDTNSDQSLARLDGLMADIAAKTALIKSQDSTNSFIQH